LKDKLSRIDGLAKLLLEYEISLCHILGLLSKEVKIMKLRALKNRRDKMGQLERFGTFFL
jgi:hypothetical protein